MTQMRAVRIANTQAGLPLTKIHSSTGVAAVAIRPASDEYRDSAATTAQIMAKLSATGQDTATSTPM